MPLPIIDTPWYLHHSSGYYQATSTLRGSAPVGSSTPPQRPLAYSGIPKRSRIDSSPGKDVCFYSHFSPIAVSQRCNGDLNITIYKVEFLMRFVMHTDADDGW